MSLVAVNQSSVAAGTMLEPDDTVDTCDECGNLGYVLNGSHAGAGNDTGPITLNITACYYPLCPASRREIASFQVLGMFTNAVTHPKTGAIMALDGFTGPVYR